MVLRRLQRRSTEVMEQALKERSRPAKPPETSKRPEVPETDPERGLTSAAAKERLSRYEPKKHVSQILKLLSHSLGTDPLDDRGMPMTNLPLGRPN